MATIRRSAERGLTLLDWLESRHTFAFGSYDDPARRGFANLRVLNDDVIAPGSGFGLHPHRDMEIVTFMLAGRLRHRDSLGHEGVLGPEDVQRMSAGRGIVHAEENASDVDSCRLLQLWIFPRVRGADPTYDQRTFPRADRRNRFRTLVSSDGRDGSLVFGADAVIEAATLAAGASLERPLDPARPRWLHVASGSVRCGSDLLGPGDAVAFESSSRFALAAASAAEVLLFTLAS